MPKEPNVKDMLKLAGADGFDKLDLEKAIEEQKEKLGITFKETKRILKLYQSVFSSGAGEIVLDDLLDKTIRLDIVDYNLDRDKGYDLALYRQGQNSMIRYILKNMAAAEKIE